MKIIYFCRESKLALEALKYLYENSEVLACFANDTDREKLVRSFCEQNKILIYTKDNINEMVAKFSQTKADLIISFTNTFILKKEHLNMAKNAINFHPGLLPDYKGISVGSYCLMQGLDEWGGAAHFIDDGIDTGNIIKVKKFKVDELRSKTGYEIARHTWKILFELLKEIITDFSQNKQIQTIKNSGGKYYSQKMLNDLKKIDLSENVEVLEKKINALWYPPYPSAYIEKDGKKFYLITEEILKEISNFYNKLDPLD